MNEEPNNSPSGGITLGDIYYVLFRHKWKIIGLSILGLIVAATLPSILSRPYQSEAKIFIRYVVEAESPSQTGGGIRSPNEGGASIINSEIEILTSHDLALQVADSVGPARILGKGAGPKDRLAAAHVIRKGLMVPPPSKSSVVRIIFQHGDPTVVQPVLNELMDSYFKKHSEVHRARGSFDDSLTQETDQLRSRLVQTENALRAAKTNAGIISLEEAKRAYSLEISRIRSEIFAAEAEMAERKAIVDEMAKLTKTPLSETNVPAGKKASVIPAEKITEYRRLNGLLDSLFKREQELSLQYTKDNLQLRGIQEQISTSEKIKEQLEKEYPGLLSVVVPESRSGLLAADPRLLLQKEMAAVVSIASKIDTLTNQLAQVRREVASMDLVEASITELQRKKELEEANYKKYLAKLEESRIDEALGSDQNIKAVQKPSPPVRDSAKLLKLMIGSCLAAFAAGLAWAFLTEFYLDRSVRRASHIISRVEAPFFLSIPRLNLNSKQRGLKPGKKVSLLNASKSANESGKEVSLSANLIAPNGDLGTIAPWDGHHPLRPFYQTLRDRLIAYFEIKNLTHTPKLVALTSCGEGAGVTTTAMGLAASLSETGEGNVLVVDMNLRDGEAHRFYKGQLECGLDDALTRDKREIAMVQENLYVVTEGENSLPHLLPKRFKHLVPKLRASDYDYIIFDMPPTSQISTTLRLAQFMDMVFLVAESEKTSQDAVRRAAELLTGTKANVGIVLNKTESYVPKRLQVDV